MIRSDTIANPITGETIRFVPCASDAVQLDYTLRAHSGVPFTHIHPIQEERFEIVAGRPRFRLGREERDTAPGDVVVVPSGTPHVFHNPTDEEVRITITFTPGQRTEEMFRVFFALARSGSLSRRSIPRNPLLGARLGYEFRRETRPIGLLGLIERLSPAGALLARLLRIRLPDV